MVTFGDLTLTWPVKHTYTGVCQYLCWSVLSTPKTITPAVWFVSLLEPRRRKPRFLTFDLCLTWPLTLNLKLSACFKFVSLRSFDRRLIFENRTVSSRVRQGGGGKTPPPQSMVFCQDPSQARVKAQKRFSPISLLERGGGHLEPPLSFCHE